MEVWEKGSEELERARPLFPAKGTICLIIKDEAAHLPPAPPGHISQANLLGAPRLPWATLLSLWIGFGDNYGPSQPQLREGTLGLSQVTAECFSPVTEKLLIPLPVSSGWR